MSLPQLPLSPTGGEGELRGPSPGHPPTPTSPSHACGVGPSLSPLKGGEGTLSVKASSMDFDLTEEQRLLRDSVDRLLADNYTFEKRRAYLAETEGWSRALWSQYAELGLLGLPFAEQHGGVFGGGAGTGRGVVRFRPAPGP